MGNDQDVSATRHEPTARYAEAENTITHCVDVEDRGGHFAALEVPELLTTSYGRSFVAFADSRYVLGRPAGRGGDRLQSRCASEREPVTVGVAGHEPSGRLGLWRGRWSFDRRFAPTTQRSLRSARAQTGLSARTLRTEDAAHDPRGLGRPAAPTKVSRADRARCQLLLLML